MEVSDGTRERAVQEKARALIEKWMDEMLATIEKEEGQTLNGTTLPAYMTAGLGLYTRLSQFVKAQGGTVTEVVMPKIKGDG